MLKSWIRVWQPKPGSPFDSRLLAFINIYYQMIMDAYAGKPLGPPSPKKSAVWALAPTAHTVSKYYMLGTIQGPKNKVPLRFLRQDINSEPFVMSSGAGKSRSP